MTYGPVKDPKKAENLYQEGLGLVRRKLYADAKERFYEAAQIFEACGQEGDYQKAMKEYNKKY